MAYATYRKKLSCVQAQTAAIAGRVPKKAKAAPSFISISSNPCFAQNEDICILRNPIRRAQEFLHFTLQNISVSKRLQNDCREIFN